MLISWVQAEILFITQLWLVEDHAISTGRYRFKIALIGYKLLICIVILIGQFLSALILIYAYVYDWSIRSCDFKVSALE